MNVDSANVRKLISALEILNRFFVINMCKSDERVLLKLFKEPPHLNPHAIKSKLSKDRVTYKIFIFFKSPKIDIGSTTRCRCSDL